MAFTADVLEQNCNQIGSCYLDLFDNTSDFDYACTEVTWDMIRTQLPPHEHARGDYDRKEVYTIPDLYDDGKFQILVCKTDQELAEVMADNKMVKNYLDNLPSEIFTHLKDLKTKGKKWDEDNVHDSLSEHNFKSSCRWIPGNVVSGPGAVWFKSMLKWIQLIDGVKTLIASGDDSAYMEFIDGYNNIVNIPTVEKTNEFHSNFKQSLKATLELLMRWEFTLGRRAGLAFTVHVDVIHKRTGKEERFSYDLYASDCTNAIGQAVSVVKSCMWDVKKNQMSVDIVNIDWHLTTPISSYVLEEQL